LKILLINLQRAGDIFQTFHIVFSLKKKYQNRKIYYLTNNVHEPALIVGTNYIEQKLSINFTLIFSYFKSSDLTKAIFI
jgi:hypothetical protein